MTSIEDALTALKTARVSLEIGDHRGAGNRAYYAVFYAARALLTTLTDIDGFTLKTHDGLRRMFELYFVKTGRIARDTAVLFNDVQQTRWSADYTAGLPSADEIVRSIEKAEVFVAACEALLRRDAP